MKKNIYEKEKEQLEKEQNHRTNTQHKITKMEQVCIMYNLSLNHLSIYKFYYGASTMVKKDGKRATLSNKYSTQNNKKWNRYALCIFYL